MHERVVLGFALEVSRQIAGFTGGVEGSCIYRSDTMIKRAIDFDLEKYRMPNGHIDMQAIHDSGVQLGGPELLLLKDKKYEDQQEYRLLWGMDVRAVDYIDVVAPLARQFCRRIDAKEWEVDKD